MTVFDNGLVAIVVPAGIVLFWMLWRRSLVGMLLGLLLAWLSVAVAAIGFAVLQGAAHNASAGGALVLCVAILCCMQIATGIAIVVARIRRRGTLDADDAGLLEG